MSGRVKRHTEVSPRDRLPREGAGASEPNGYFFTGEIVVMLDLGDIDYQQVRRLLLVVREQAGQPPPASRKWSRYSLTDIAGLEVLLALCGGREALAAGRRLQIAPVKRACRALRDLGVDNPLLEVPMHRTGRRVLATLNGHLLDPVTGQLALDDGYRRVEAFLEQRRLVDAELHQRLQEERAAGRNRDGDRVVKGHLVL